ncbi:MAG: DNA polymerase/3'-5' exonuclease PolX [Candidatus Marsarchaeota archaeon]|jgi:DNA polymerase (family 10)|nr:DNA polymerase/3'-5' exonuclease PolX [Candidatus Marsarchaeota archaeon]MCL5111435.1 DNA polymerase/3'-5' exonuclease PolX [Candidatus Marsarchaeota archaeon]
MENKGIADILNVIAQLMSLSDKPTARFEVRAYQKAALTIETLQEPIEDIYKKGGLKELMELPGIGKSIASHIEEYIKTGKIKKYEELKKRYPFDMGSLTTITGMGAKKAILLYKKLGIKNLSDLKKAAESHKISGLEGFGVKSEGAILKSLAIQEASKGRMFIEDALPEAESLINKLAGSGLVEKVMIAGSARRMRETVGDIDILAISKKNEDVMEFFTKMKEVSGIIAKGPTKSTVMLKLGISCDLRVLEPKSFGAAVQYFTGSKDHNIQTRTIAVKKGYKLNEYGLFNRKGRNVGGVEEESIYGKLGLQWMPPEMREARGEVELAQQHKIPTLVERKDIHGDLHTHTRESDGINTLEEMADAARKLGYEYITNSDHTKSTPIANGKDDKGFERILKHVDKLNDQLDGKFTVLKGAECDILKDGSLDLSKKTLKQMDCVLGAVHNNTLMEKKQMTDRIVKALDSGLIHVLAHPTGRIVGKREPYQVDLEKVAEAAERNNVALEINSTRRMDLSDTNIMLVSKYKIMFAIDTDSHRTNDYSFMRYGVGTARRGWLQKDRILNTLPLRELIKRLNG